MAHELAFADAARPSPVVVLNLLLSEYSIGHELLLYRRRNALLILSQSDFSKLDFWQQIHAIREALWVCSDSFSKRDAFERPAPIMWAFRWNEFKRRRWVKTLKRLLPEDYALAAAEFRNYVTAAQSCPEAPTKYAISILYDDDNNGRIYGQPFILALYNFICTLPASERPKCAWDFSYARAAWLYYAKCESEGDYRIENAKERQVDDERKQFEREIAEEKAAAEKKPSAKAPEKSGGTGLATNVPDELKGSS